MRSKSETVFTMRTLRTLPTARRGFRNGRMENRMMMMCSSSSLVEGDVEDERIRDEIEVSFVFFLAAFSRRKHEKRLSRTEMYRN